MDLKVYFKLKGRIVMLILGIFSMSMLLIMSIWMLSNNIWVGFVFLIVLLLCMFGFYCSEIYGIRIKNNKVRIISQNKVKFAKLDEVEEIYVEFIKIKNYYEAYITLELTNGNEYRFIYDKIRVHRGGNRKFNITDENVYSLKDKLLECDKIVVDIK